MKNIAYHVAEILDAMGDSLQRKKLRKIITILFEGFDDRNLLRNQKFDFSFSHKKKEPNLVRFSYNNFDEHEAFVKKIIDVFSLFGKSFDLDLLRLLLEKTNSANAPFQTTIGFEWKKGEKIPRIKIYFEELFHFYGRTERMQLLELISEIMLSPIPDIGNNEIGAIAVDFLPQKRYDLKVYCVKPYVGKADIIRLLEEYHAKALIPKLDLFYKYLNKEKKCFYYLTFRTHGRKLKSLKLYRIYEVQQIADFRNAFDEIGSLLSAAELKRTSLKRLLNTCKKNSLLAYPVIVSIDMIFPDKFKIDTYISLKKPL